MRKKKNYIYAENNKKNTVEKILENVRLHEHIIREWNTCIGSRISYEFSHIKDAEKDPDSFFPPIEERFSAVRSRTLREGLLVGLWDGACEICCSHEGNAVCTDEEQNAFEKRIYDSAKKFYDRYDKMMIDTAAKGRCFECVGEEITINAHIGDKHDEYAVVIGIDYTVKGEHFTAECTVSEDTIYQLCYWENTLADGVEEFCYNIVDYYDDEHILFSFEAEKADNGINVRITVQDGSGIHEFNRNMSRIEYYDLLNLFEIIRTVFLDSRRCWM